ncbi:MAG TPA: sulfate ABC transporter permease subunit CysT [Mycobacteriales bacterium]|nr:sulfate ABC transporter permease subunit CysT [Mycobacteriales bacterium]
MTTTDLTAPVAAAPRGGSGRRRRAEEAGSTFRFTPLTGVGLGSAVLWMSLLVLLPLAAVVLKSTDAGWSGFWDSITGKQAAGALRFTVGSSLLVCAINAVMGTLIAWVLVRDDFPGKRLVENIIDVPFALPTIVAGLVMNTLYGTDSPVGIVLYGKRAGIVIALLFVTLPFVVRTVQPVLMAMETDVEEAAASLGASPLTTFRRIVLPTILPAIAAGTALAFARAMGEYGSVVLIGGQLNKTQTSSVFAYNAIQDGELADAAATATVLLVVAILVIGGLDLLQRWAARRG